MKPKTPRTDDLARGNHNVPTWWAEALEEELAAEKATNLSLLYLIADIREAVGDPAGRLMQGELVDHCRKLKEERDAAVAQVERIKEGYEGCCYACEPVGELNQKLEKELQESKNRVPEHIYTDALHQPHFDGKKFEYESNAEEARKEISTVVELPLWALTAVEEHVQRRIEKAIKFDREKLVQYIESQKYFLRI